MQDEALTETMLRNLVPVRIVIVTLTADGITECLVSAFNYSTPADYARSLPPATARPDAQENSSVCRATAKPAPIGAYTHRALVASV